MYQVSGLEKMSNCCLMLAVTGTDFSASQAQPAPTRTNGIQKNAAFWYQTSWLA